MSARRLIIEMGMGVDLHGSDYTKAAGRAIDDALHHSYLAIIKALDIPEADVHVRATIGVQAPDQLDVSDLKAKFPVGQVTIQPEVGGMNVTDPQTGVTHVVASAAVEVFLPEQTGWRISRQPTGPSA